MSGGPNDTTEPGDTGTPEQEPGRDLTNDEVEIIREQAIEVIARAIDLPTALDGFSVLRERVSRVLQKDPRRYDRPSRLLAAVRVGARNFVRDKNRELRVRKEVTRTVYELAGSLASHAASPQRQLEMDETRQIVQRSINRMPEHRGRCIGLVLEGLSAAEIGKVMGIDVKTVEYHVARAREDLTRDTEGFWRGMR